MRKEIKYFTKSGKEVELGSVVGTVEEEIIVEGEPLKKTYVRILDSELAEELVSHELLVREEKRICNLLEELDLYCNRNNITPESLNVFLSQLRVMFPASHFSFLLHIIAVAMDKMWDDNIASYKEVYIISLSDGRIHKEPTAHFKNFENISVFRTLEEAKLACSLLREPLKAMFKNGK